MRARRSDATHSCTSLNRVCHRIGSKGRCCAPDASNARLKPEAPPIPRQVPSQGQGNSPRSSGLSCRESVAKPRRGRPFSRHPRDTASGAVRPRGMSSAVSAHLGARFLARACATRGSSRSWPECRSPGAPNRTETPPGPGNPGLRARPTGRKPRQPTLEAEAERLNQAAVGRARPSFSQDFDQIRASR